MGWVFFHSFFFSLGPAVVTGERAERRPRETKRNGRCRGNEGVAVGEQVTLLFDAFSPLPRSPLSENALVLSTSKPPMCYICREKYCRFHAEASTALQWSVAWGREEAKLWAVTF